MVQIHIFAQPLILDGSVQIRNFPIPVGLTLWFLVVVSLLSLGAAYSNQADVRDLKRKVKDIREDLDEME